MPRKLTATTGVLLALVLAGCGKDEPAGTAAQSAATATTPGATTPSGSETSTDATSAGTTQPRKTTTVTQKPARGTRSTGSDAAAGSGDDAPRRSGSGPAPERLGVLSTLRRYYKAFIDKDGETACSLLTTAGQAAMIADGKAKTCAASAERLVEQAGAKSLTLLETTRDGLRTGDITVTGNNAIVLIGEQSRLRLVQQNGRWLVRSPNVTSE